MPNRVDSENNNINRIDFQNNNQFFDDSLFDNSDSIDASFGTYQNQQNSFQNPQQSFSNYNNNNNEGMDSFQQYTPPQHIAPNHLSNNQKKPKRKKGIVFWLSLFVMIAAIVALCIIGAGYFEGSKMYNDIADDVFKDRSDDASLSSLNINWDELLAINPETVGWIYIPNTVVNYPVVHTTDNDKYLKTTFRGYRSYISFGTIFVDCNNKHDLSDENIVLYGHHMNDGSMFALFSEMKNSDVFNQHRDIYFLTPNGNYRLKTFTLCKVDATEKIIQTNFGIAENRIKYINDKISRKIIDVSGQIPDPALMDKIFTFSTCDNFSRDKRFICYAYVAESTVAGVEGLD